MDIHASVTAGKPIRCRAAVCRKAGEPLSIEEIEVDPPKAWEVRIKVLCTSLCHSDLSSWKLDSGPTAVFPRIFGHEAIGVVESVGENVDEVGEGDTVLPVFQPHCGDCSDCKSPRSNRCSVFRRQLSLGMSRDGTSRFRGSDGKAIHHFLRVSSFSEYTVVDIANVVKVDGSCPVDRACLLSCGVSTGLGAAWKLAEVHPGSTVATSASESLDLRWQWGQDCEEPQRSSALTIIPTSSKKEVWGHGFHRPFRLWREARQRGHQGDDGRRCGLLFRVQRVGLGHGGCLRQQPRVNWMKLFTEANACSCTVWVERQGWGKTVILGVDMSGTPMRLSSFEFLKGKTVIGSSFGGLKPKVDIPLLIQKYLAKELNLDDFITREMGFQDINEAFDLMLRGKILRCIMWMDK